MTSYIYSKWKNTPAGCPAEFYSELDDRRYESRKIEVFPDGKVGYAFSGGSTLNTRLGIEPVPSISEIQSQPEFEIREISVNEFDTKWKELVEK